MSEEILTTFKVIIVGSMGVGKTRILSQLVNKDVEPEPTLAPSQYTKNYNINGETIRIVMWDTAGQERFHALPSVLFRDVQGAVLVYDVTDFQSFKDLHKWLNFLKEFYDGLDQKPVITVLGNKIDLDGREVSRREGLNFARKNTALFLETSAKTGEGVDTAFEDLVAKIRDTPGLWKRNPESRGVYLQQSTPSDQSSWYQWFVRCWY